MSDITQTSLKLVVLDFRFMCDDMVQHRLNYDWFGTQSILASTFGTVYILAGMYGTYYTLASTYRTDYIQAVMDRTNSILLGSYVRKILYCSH